MRPGRCPTEAIWKNDRPGITRHGQEASSALGVSVKLVRRVCPPPLPAGATCPTRVPRTRRNWTAQPDSGRYQKDG